MLDVPYFPIRFAIPPTILRTSAIFSIGLRACRERRPVDVFRVDYPTPDGSCVRDYAHVSDLCRAHLAALEYLWDGGDNNALNLGSERGFSVLEVIKVAEQICSQTIEHRIASRRGGDAPILVASSQKSPKRSGVDADRKRSQDDHRKRVAVGAGEDENDHAIIDAFHLPTSGGHCWAPCNTLAI